MNLQWLMLPCCLTGKWLPARVVEVDASLVKMVFESERHCEWIYRGSTRLAPMYAELVPVQPRKLGTGARRNIMNTMNLGKVRRPAASFGFD